MYTVQQDLIHSRDVTRCSRLNTVSFLSSICNARKTLPPFLLLYSEMVFNVKVLMAFNVKVFNVKVFNVKVFHLF